MGGSGLWEGRASEQRGQDRTALLLHGLEARAVGHGCQMGR
jgi:hypothetical protein